MSGKHAPVVDASEPKEGDVVEVYWKLDAEWYRGVVGKKRMTGEHKGLRPVKYSDGDMEILDFSKETWRKVDDSPDVGHDGVNMSQSYAAAAEAARMAAGGVQNGTKAASVCDEETASSAAREAQKHAGSTSGECTRPSQSSNGAPTAKRRKVGGTEVADGKREAHRLATASAREPAAGVEIAQNVVGRMTLKDRVAVVTGGHRGLGAAITVGLASMGADVIVIDRNGPGDTAITGVVEGLGQRIWSLTANLSEEDDVRAAASGAMDIARKAGKKVSVLVNNAGIALLSPAHEASVTDWDKTQAVNVRAPMLLAQSLLSDLRGSGCGSVINISSAAGGGALVDHMAYCTSKAAVNALTKNLALEWGKFNIRVNAVAPTVVMTEMGKRVWSEPQKGTPMLARIPLNRFAEPHEVSDLVCFLATPASSMINAQTISVDGGFNCA